MIRNLPKSSMLDFCRNSVCVNRFNYSMIEHIFYSTVINTSRRHHSVIKPNKSTSIKIQFIRKTEFLISCLFWFRQTKLQKWRHDLLSDFFLFLICSRINWEKVTDFCSWLRLDLTSSFGLVRFGFWFGRYSVEN